MVHFLLRLAVHYEGNQFVELEMRPPVKRSELLAIELKDHGHDPALGTGARIAVAADSHDLRVGKDRDIELRGFFGLGVEPKERADVRHSMSSAE
jgi:hypothetical protein